MTARGISLLAMTVALSLSLSRGIGNAPTPRQEEPESSIRAWKRPDRIVSSILTSPLAEDVRIQVRAVIGPIMTPKEQIRRDGGHLGQEIRQITYSITVVREVPKTDVFAQVRSATGFSFSKVDEAEALTVSLMYPYMPWQAGSETSSFEPANEVSNFHRLKIQIRPKVENWEQVHTNEQVEVIIVPN